MSDERLSALLERYLDGQLDEQERTELEEMLRSSAAGRAQFWHDTRLHGLLHEAEHAGTGPSRVGSGGTKKSWSRWTTLAALGLAGALLLGGAAWQWRKRVIFSALETPAQPLIGELHTSSDAQWAGETPTALLRPGQYQLDRGVVEMILGGGSVLTVQAPARFTLRDGSDFSLDAGRLRAEIGSARLDLHSPAGNWTVREASLGLAVQESGVEAQVFRGSVSLPGGPPLAAPEAVRFAGGTRTAIAGDEAAFPTGSRTIDLPLANGDFEDEGGIDGEGVPGVFGKWSGDYAASVSAEDGVQPKRGQRMLRLRRAEPLSQADRPPLVSAEQWQLVDLQPWKEQLAGGNATVEIGAWFNRRPGPTSTRRFGVGIFGCQGPPAQAPQMWAGLGPHNPGHAGTHLLADDDLATWERAEAQFVVPEDTDFVIVAVMAIRRPLPPNAPREFEGHYVDDVTLTLRVPPRRGR